MIHMRLSRVGKWGLYVILGTVVVSTLCLSGLDLYFSRIFPISARLSQAAITRTKIHHIRPLTFSQIPPTFISAIIATEDRHFYSDPGIDPEGILRAAVVDIKTDSYAEGGSTITQQLVDNTLLGKQKTLHRKVMQALYAIGIYDTVSKSDVLTLYTNLIYFGHGAYGLYNAAETYFNKPPWALNSNQLTLLAGLPNSPHLLNPDHSLTRAKLRQHEVIDSMVDTHVISRHRAGQILAEPLGLTGHMQNA
jgi:membrane peptidoglycan carboxypeptidase